MSRRIAGLATLVLLALCVGAVAGDRAAASNLELHECWNASITSFSLVRYANSECTTEKAGGAWGWKLTSEAVSGTVSMAGSSSLAATVAGIKFRIECSGLNGSGSGENSGGKILGTGIVVHYTGCTVPEPTGGKCSVAEELSTNSLKAESNGTKIKYVPTSGATYMTISVSGATCPEALKGTKEVKGQATAAVEGTGSVKGAIQSFTATSGSELTYGGQAATFLSTNGAEAVSGVELGALPVHPLSLELHECWNSGITTTSAVRYASSECTTEKARGAWGWKLTSSPVSGSVSMASASSLAATIGGVKFKVECSGLNGSGSGENSLGAILGTAIVLHYTGCATTEPAGGKCVVPTELSTNTLKAESGEMKVRYEAAGAGPIMSVTIAGSECPEALKGVKELTGQATALVEGAGGFNGTIQSFTATSGSALKLGGQPATYLGSNGAEDAIAGVSVGAVTP